MRIKIRWGKLCAALFITSMVLLVFHIAFDAPLTIDQQDDSRPNPSPITFWLGDVNALLKARPDFIASTTLTTDPLERSFGRTIVLQDLPHAPPYESLSPSTISISTHIPRPQYTLCDTLALHSPPQPRVDIPLCNCQLKPDSALRYAGFRLTKTNLPPCKLATQLCFELVFSPNGRLEYALGLAGDRNVLREVESFLMRSARTNKAVSGRITMEW